MAAVAVAALASACVPAPTPQRYRDLVFADVSTAKNLTYATAPALGTGTTTPLRLDIYRPIGDTVKSRPAIVWIHGGGFKSGSKTQLSDVATAYARRGYVTASIDYRLDAGNRCQEVQDGAISDPAAMAVELERCRTAIRTAQYDAQAAIRWLRAHAKDYGIDPGRIAVGGFSAGAVTAVNVADNATAAGDVGTDLGQSSQVGAALAASGCNFNPADIDRTDAPTSLLASRLDRAVDFSCVQSTETAMRNAGVAVSTRYYLNESTHAKALYDKYIATVDADWTAFLIAHLHL